ncbi:uncharacterized protein Atac3 isoform X1 [Drosophila tropicalis]|uniref:uncharacterized protein Atac3 isoform X1 n=1 Tax=Drosophila tropicalis TaxID=46794 RepID=UPI0035AC1B4B
MHSHNQSGASASKVVARLTADGQVYPNQNQNLLHYEIRTEGEKGTATATCLDLGKQLLQCSKDSDVMGVKTALGHGAPFASDWLGMSALHFAAMNNQLEICEILLQAGCNMDAKTKVDRTPLHLACYYGHERIVSLLLALKCSVNSRDMLRMTPLHWAVEKRHKIIVRLLLKCQADVTLVSKFGKTPIALAVLTEQADILSELETARQAQANRKYNEETEKETSDAVNSIMDETLKTSENVDMSVEEKMDVLENLRGPGSNVLGDTALNMLKSHGIADMMQDNDDEASKDMLNTALQNGRKLVLSEAGRMVLHETKTTQSVNGSTPTYRKIANPVTNTHSSPPQKIRMNVIKQKESISPSTCAGLTKNKNIRIISLTDFKKLCGSSTDNQAKSVQKIPGSLASSGVVRQLSYATKLVNMRHLQSRQLKLPSLRKPLESGSTDEQQHLLNEAITTPISPHNLAMSSTLRGQVGTVQTIQLRPSQSTGSTSTNNGTAFKNATRSNLRGANELNANTRAPNVMPLLTSSEICRQLHELRRQNDELRRSVDSIQKEKEEMRKRIEHLEQQVLLGEAQEVMQYVND